MMHEVSSVKGALLLTMAVDVQAEDYTTHAAALKLSNMLKAHITDAELRMHAVSLMLDLLHPDPNYRATVQEALTSDFLAI